MFIFYWLKIASILPSERAKYVKCKNKRLFLFWEWKLTWCWDAHPATRMKADEKTSLFTNVRVSRETYNFDESEVRMRDRDRHCGNVRKERCRCLTNGPHRIVWRDTTRCDAQNREYAATRRDTMFDLSITFHTSEYSNVGWISRLTRLL